jgi:hypothetical protein
MRGIFRYEEAAFEILKYVCRISGSHSGVYEEYHLLGYNAV